MIKFELNEKYRRNVSEDEMIADLKRVASQLGKDSVTKKEYDKNGKYYSETMRRKIGSWFKILSKAGLYKTRNLGLTDEDLVGDLIRVSQKLKRILLQLLNMNNMESTASLYFNTISGHGLKH